MKKQLEIVNNLLAEFLQSLEIKITNIVVMLQFPNFKDYMFMVRTPSITLTKYKNK